MKYGYAGTERECEVDKHLNTVITVKCINIFREPYTINQSYMKKKYLDGLENPVVTLERGDTIEGRR